MIRLDGWWRAYFKRNVKSTNQVKHSEEQDITYIELYGVITDEQAKIA